MKKLLSSLTFLFSFALLAEELDIAKEALRDGLWEIARNHAEKVEGDEAKLVILESYAREARWSDLLKTMDSWAEPTGEGFSYYRALALAETGRRVEARQILDDVKMSDAGCLLLAARLRARIAMAEGDVAGALKILREFGFAEADDESRMAAADILVAAGKHADAERIWRGIAARTNVAERIFTTAAINLGDREILQRAYAQARTPALRRLAGLRCGVASIAVPATLDDGAAIIRALVTDAPDTEGAKDAYLAMADAYLAADRCAEAATAYAYALETWPETAFMAVVQEGRGWALRRQGKGKEAVEAFAKAEEVATTDEDRARAALAHGDTLAEIGRGDEAMAKYRLVLDRYPATAAGEKLKAQMKLRELEAHGRELLRNYDFEGAMAVFAELTRLAPARKARSDFYSMLCLFGQHQDDAVRQKAHEIIANAAVDDAIRAETTLWLAKFEFNNRRWAESRRLFAAYADLDPRSAKAPSALTWAARAAFAENDFAAAIESVSKLVERYPNSPERLSGYIVQAEALIELARFDEAVLVLDRAALVEGVPAADRLRAQVLKADALFAMGADNAVRYREALDAYRALSLGESLPPELQLIVAIKIARTLEKLKRTDEAFDQYYSEVVLAYRKGRREGIRYDDETRAAFARAAFRLADEYERRGRDFQAMSVLELVRESDVPAAGEAAKRIVRIQAKGNPQ
ncbi:MAG: tol-pal system YbgF family protein [Kiritimatiellia bacterium]